MIGFIIGGPLCWKSFVKSLKKIQKEYLGHTIVTFDEANFRLVPVYKRVWFLKGQKPEGVFFWSNKQIYIFGALTNGRKLFYEFYTSLNSLTYSAFLDHFIKKLSKKKNYVFLFDNASYHKSSVIKEYLAELKHKIKIEFFPPYSPELNPTETCWKIIRSNVTNSTYFPTLENMQKAIECFLEQHFFYTETAQLLMSLTKY